MSSLYVDTSVVLKLVLDEPLSAVAQRLLEDRAVPVLYTSIMEAETGNTLHAKRHRREITGPQLRACQSLIRALLDDGRFVRPELSMDRVVADALSLMPTVVVGTGCRTLDLFHVSAARLLKCGEFVTCDDRQGRAAAVAGFQVTVLRS